MSTGPAWTEEEDRMLIKLWDEDTPGPEISRLIGRPQSSIYTRCRSLKLPRRQRTGKSEIVYEVDYFVEVKIRRCNVCSGIFETDVVRRFACEECMT